MSEYYIGVNQNGEPYIAHAWGQRGPNQSHKYIAKIGEGIKARYFYTPEELRAFQMGGRQKAQNAVNAAKQKTANVANKVKEKASDTAGRIRENSTLLNVGNQYRAAQRAHKNSKSSDPETAKWGKKGYDDNNTLGGKAYKAQQKAKDTIDNAKQKLISNVNDAYKKRFDVAAIDRRGSTYTDNYIDRAEKTRKKADEYAKNHKGERDSALDLVAENAKEDLEKAKKEKNKFERSVKSTSDRMKEEFRKIKDESIEKAKDIVGVDERERRDQSRKQYEEAEDRYRNAKLNTAREKDKGNSDKYWDAERNESKAKAEFDQAERTANSDQAYYNRTLLGMAERLNKKKNNDAKTEKLAKDYLKLYKQYENALTDSDSNQAVIKEFEKQLTEIGNDLLEVNKKATKNK